MKKTFLLFLVTFITATFSIAQNVAINADGTLPNNSAMLDVKNPNKGILIPRVALTGSLDVSTIPSPAISLLVYNTTTAGVITPGYYYWSGGAWIRLISGNDPNTAWLLTGNAGTSDVTNFIGTTDNTSLNFRVNNQKAGKIDAAFGNTYLGQQAGNVNNAGGSNTGIGRDALLVNVNGDLNTAVGRQALASNTDGYSNTAVGYRGLNTNTIGFNNTALGNNANVSTNNLFNATAIGNGAIVSASNSVQIGNSLVTVVRFGRNDVGGAALYAGSYNTVSDARFKYNIKDNVPGLDFINKLTPVTYYLDGEKLERFTTTGLISNNHVHAAYYKGEQKVHTGFLAQDVEKIALDLGYVFDGVRLPANNNDHYSIAYSQFVIPLVKAVQELNSKVESLIQENKILKHKQVDPDLSGEIPATVGKQQVIIDQQKSDINTLKDQVEALSKAVKQLSNK